MYPTKRRKVESPTNSRVANLHFETYCITGISQERQAGSDKQTGSESETTKFLSVKDCLTDYQVYDVSGGLETSPPPCHPSSFLFDKWKTTDVTLKLSNSEFSAHRDHLAQCCRYFEGMFRSSMLECSTQDIRLHGVDEPSFRAILSSFYTGFLSVCSECVLRLLKTGTYLQSDVILQVCENYILSHIDLKTVFQVLDVTAELGFDAITNKAVKLICANLGPESNLCESEEFLDLAPRRMLLIMQDNCRTNCSETELAAALFRWAARTWEWYDMITPSNVSSDVTNGSQVTSAKREDGSNSLDDSGIVISDEYVLDIPLLDEYVLEFPPPGDDIFDFPSPPPPPPGVHQSREVELSRDMAQSHDMERPHDSHSRRNRKTYKKRSRKSPKKGRDEVDDVSCGSRKRKREHVEDEENSPQRSEIVALRADIEQVLLHLEFSNMEPESLRSFLELDVVRNIPALFHHIRRMADSVHHRCYPERGSTVAVTLCYHRCYRSLGNPTRSTILYYLHNNRWHTLDNSLNVNLISAKSLILNNLTYMFGMYKPPGQPAITKAYRFNQFTGYWRELASPLYTFNSSVRVITHNDTILMIGSTNVGASGFASFQQRNVKIVQYFPQKNSWKEVEGELPITNHQLQRYVNSIISHKGALYYVSKNKLCSFDIDAETPGQTEVAVVSHMFTDISNYWLFGYKDKILLLGGLCTVQGGGSWQNREILIYSEATGAWTIVQNEKPSPMYEMMSGVIYDDKIYTVSHAAAAGESVAKVELFDLEKFKWKKGLNLKYESPVQCVEYGITAGCMLVKPPAC